MLPLVRAGSKQTVHMITVMRKEALNGRVVSMRVYGGRQCARLVMLERRVRYTSEVCK